MQHDRDPERHRMEIYNWNKGVLEIFELFFDTLKAALRYVKGLVCSFFKIFFKGELVSCGPDPEEGYC